MTTDHRLSEESSAFDRQITERIRNGHIPDLRLAQPCEYFYNNPWRHPEYVKLDFGEQFALLDDAIRSHAPRRVGPLKVLEVGCGPGYMTLELARGGYQVVGIDISPGCIEAARHFAEIDPWREERGGLTYMAADFFTTEELLAGSFDAIVFVGTLHHFKDQQKIMRQVSNLLVKNGIILAHEPTRDRITEGNAVFINLVQVLLSLSGGFYSQRPIPSNEEEQEKQIKQVFSELKYEDTVGNKVQSANDNDAGHTEMCGCLKEHFTELVYRERYAFFHEIIGGLRFDEATNILLAEYLRDMDALLCKRGVLQPTEFFFVGQKREND
jgi:2-polyprenyl-3-methyl-5-hydroxy-6-metoxy-1,4-benzoquinol methylase